MVKTLQKHGNSQALVIEKPVLDLLGITQDTPLQITVSGSSLVITPIHVGIGADEVKASVARLRPRYRRMLENLAE